MRIARYDGNEFPIDDDTLSVDQIKEVLATQFPELAKSEAMLNGDFIDFTMKAADKG